MSDELLVEDVEISEQEPQLICPEDGEVQESEESKYGYRTSIFVDDGISTPENPGMRIRARAGHPFLIDAEDWPRISKFKWSVSRDNSCGRYKARIMKDRVNHNLGRFRDQRSAAMAYYRAAQEMFGEFAYTNLIYQDCEEDARPSLGEAHRSNLPYSLAS